MNTKLITTVALLIFILVIAQIFLFNMFMPKTNASTIIKNKYPASSGASINPGNSNIQSNNQNSINPSPSSSPSSSSLSTNPDTTPIYSISDVNMHNNPKDCWVIVNNKVYDVTNYINEHPGGPSSITRYCGKDETSAFEGKHSGSRSANSILSTLFIGNLQ